MGARGQTPAFSANAHPHSLLPGARQPEAAPAALGEDAAGARGTLPAELPHSAEALPSEPRVMVGGGIRRGKNATLYAGLRHSKEEGCRPGRTIAISSSSHTEYNVGGAAVRVPGQ